MLKRFFFAGLLIWVPIGVTAWVISFIVSSMDSLFPQAVSPQALFGIHIPGFGLVVVSLVVLITGLLATNLLGRQLLAVWEAVLAKIPLVRSIYSSVKQVSDTILSPNGQAFREAALIQYPRAGSYTIAFITGTPAQELQGHLPSDSVSVYVPTTPNPTSGFFLMLPRSEVIPLNIPVDAALKYVVSMGTVPPTASTNTTSPSA